MIKVFHDCRNDSGVLHAQNDILLQNVFDTQVSRCGQKLLIFLSICTLSLPMHKPSTTSKTEVLQTPSAIGVNLGQGVE